ncbi:hypothetical protein U1Q18_042563, partial [Sarracenia purpurea var. burkii]
GKFRSRYDPGGPNSSGDFSGDSETSGGCAIAKEGDRRRRLLVYLQIHQVLLQRVLRVARLASHVDPFLGVELLFRERTQIHHHLLKLPQQTRLDTPKVHHCSQQIHGVGSSTMLCERCSMASPFSSLMDLSPPISYLSLIVPDSWIREWRRHLHAFLEICCQSSMAYLTRKNHRIAENHRSDIGFLSCCLISEPPRGDDGNHI